MRRNRLILAGIAAAVCVATALLWYAVLEPAHREARIATGYVAKSLCSCVFIDARDFDACRRDLAPPFSRVAASIDRSGKRVRAWVDLLAHDLVAFDESYGCALN